MGYSPSFICCRSASVLSFFFSSRRRHTRCSRDWSSDVCSSDLDYFLRGHLPLAHELSLTDSLLPHIVASINHGVASLDVREALTSPPRHEVIVQLGTLFHKFVICIWRMELLERRLWCGPLLRPRR